MVPQQKVPFIQAKARRSELVTTMRYFFLYNLIVRILPFIPELYVVSVVACIFQQCLHKLCFNVIIRINETKVFTFCIVLTRVACGG